MPLFVHMQIPSLVEACGKYMLDTLESCKPSWAWVIFTIAQQLQSITMQIVKRAAAVELVSAALTNNIGDAAILTAASIAIKEAGPSPAAQLSCIEEGISKAVCGAKNPSQAFLVVLLMRLDQLVAAADVIVGSNGESSSSSTTAQLLPLNQEEIIALLKLVKWDSLHNVELATLSSQADSYKHATSAATYMRSILEKRSRERLTWVAEKLPQGQSTLQYLAGWLETADLMNEAPVRRDDGSSGPWINLPVSGATRGLKCGNIEVSLLVQYGQQEAQSSGK